ncbi:MAG: SDR family NAD(P)-dependent oxidoreductase [Candidatus Ventricola sp.]
MLTLKGRTMIITGGAGNNGTAIVKMALANGMNVALMSGYHSKAQDAIKRILRDNPEYEGRVIGFAQNPQAKLEWNMEAAPELYKPDSKMADVHRWIYEAFGSIDVVVNAKGGHIRYDFDHTDKTIWRHSMEVVESAFVNVKLALPYLEKSKAARVINITSCDGRHGGWLHDPSFAAARGGLEALTYEMAKELGPRGITCNCVLLGHIEGDVPGEDTLDDATRARVLAGTPLGRMGVTQDVPAVVEFLASEEAGFVNGARIDVNGGFMIG